MPPFQVRPFQVPPSRVRRGAPLARAPPRQRVDGPAAEAPPCAVWPRTEPLAARKRAQLVLRAGLIPWNHVPQPVSLLWVPNRYLQWPAIKAPIEI